MSEDYLTKFDTMVREEYNLKDVLCEREIQHILEELIGNKDYNLVDTELKKASETLIGFLGEHFRATLKIQIKERKTPVHLFIKRIPLRKEARTSFIQNGKFFQRETVALNICKEFIGAYGPNPWCCIPTLAKENLIVMPDLAAEGYRTRSQQIFFDLQHTLVTVASIARFHADYANYETMKSIVSKHPYTILQDHSELLKEVVFVPSPLLVAAKKTAINYIREYSNRFGNKIYNLEETFLKTMQQTCDILTKHKNSLNVMLHKDLWTNNIMFKYSNDKPNNAVLVDFQCAGYGPPAFDIMIFLYLTTSRIFREQHEQEVFKHYFSVFLETVDAPTKEKLNELKYDYEQFEKWCEFSRVYGAMRAICSLPYVAMDGAATQQSLADPDKFEEYIYKDRTEPVLAYARQNDKYKQRLLEIYEEFIEKFVVE